MTGYLIDTSALSVLDRRVTETWRSDFVAWMRRVEPDIRISAVSVYEIEVGRLKLERRRQEQRAAEVAELPAALTATFMAKILPFDGRVAVEAARSGEGLRSESIEVKDLFIAATASVHDLTIVTRNVRHFERTGVSVVDPADGLPPG